jgi:hypothetical protein
MICCASSSSSAGSQQERDPTNHDGPATLAHLLTVQERFLPWSSFVTDRTMPL